MGVRDGVKYTDVQGFYFSTPLTADELEIYLKDPSHIKTALVEEVK